MADKECLNVLKQGVHIWNEWREENPGPPDLRGTDLSEMKLRNVNFTWTDLREANLCWADLYEADFYSSDLRGAEFEQAELHRANFEDATLNEANLREANLEQADFSGACLFRVNLRGANLRGAKLLNSYLEEANLIKADLSEGDLTGGYLYGTARDNWIIDGITCRYIYWDDRPNFKGGEEDLDKRWWQEHRIPKDRDFALGEFEERYKQLPTFIGSLEKNSIADLVRHGESITLEFKSTLQWDVEQNKKNRDLRNSSLKTIAAFLNSEGGTLIIGVADDGSVFGLQHDLSLVKGGNLDGFEQTLMSLIKEFLGPEFARSINVHFGQLDEKDVCAITVSKTNQPVFMKGEKGKVFYVRLGNTTHDLDAEKTYKYIEANWK